MKKVVRLILVMMLSLGLCLAIFPEVGTAAPLAATYSWDEGSTYTTGTVYVWDSTTYYVTSVSTDFNDCDDYGLTVTSGFDNHLYVFPLDHHVVAMGVYGTVSKPGSCTFKIKIDKDDGTSNFDYVTWTFTLNNVNEAPTDISLSTNSVDENLPVGSLVATLTTTDPDVAEGIPQTFTYGLYQGAVYPDNTKFSIVNGDELVTADSFDYETVTSYTINIRTKDAGGGFFIKHFLINVNNVNEAPEGITLTGSTVAENKPAATRVGTFSGTDPEGDSITYSLVSGAGSTDNAKFYIVGSFLNTLQGLDYEADSSLSIRVRASDPGGAYTDSVFTITVTNVNEAPVISNTSPTAATILEDAAYSLVVSAADPEGSAMTYSVSTAPAHGTAALSGTTVTYDPDANFTGSDSFTVSVSDGILTDTLTVNMTITAVNDPPSFTKGSNQIVDEDDGLISVSNWAASILKGGGSDEAVQTLTFHVSSTNTILYSQQPAVTADGTLTYRPADDAHGSATVTIYLTDDGGTANGGSATSASTTFTITVNPINDAPVLTTTPALTLTGINEDNITSTGMTVTALLATGAGGDPISDVDDNAAEGVGRGIAVISADNSNGAWQYSTNGTIWTAFNSPTASSARLLTADGVTRVRFVPNANWNGTISQGLQVRAWDQAPGSGTNGGTANASAYGGITAFSSGLVNVSLTVAAVNDPPSFTKGSNQTVNEDAGLISVSTWASSIVKGGGSDEAVQILTFTLTHTNNALFSQQPAVTADGTLTYRPADDAHGATTVTIYLADDGGTANGGSATSASTTFTITVNPINDAPVLTTTPALTLTGINEDNTTSTGMTITALLATGASGNPISDVDDNAAEGIGRGIAVIAADNTNGAWQYSTNGTIWTAFGSPTASSARLLAADGVTRVRFVPNADWNGTISQGLQFRAWDQAPGSGTNGGTANTGSYGGTYAFSSGLANVSLIVTAVNDAPTFTAGASPTVLEDAGPQSVLGWAQGVSKGAANETSQVLTYTILTNSNTGLFSTQPAVNANGDLTYTPKANAHGAATLTINVKDDGGTTNSGADTGPTRTFTITISPVNDAPVLDSSGSTTVSAVNEDDITNTGMTVTALLATGAGGSPVTDVDDNAAEGTGRGIAVIEVQDGGHGSWQYTTDGAIWTAFGSPSAAAALLLAADATTRVRFVPEANWNGTLSQAITFRAWDQAPGSGSNGGTADITATGTGYITPFSASYEIASFTVNPINDAPRLDNSAAFTLDTLLEDQEIINGTAVSAIIDSAGGDRISEASYEISPVEGIAVTAVNETNGAWQYTLTGGSTWLSLTGVSPTSARLLASNSQTKIRFLPASNWSLLWANAQAPAITFRAWDQTSAINGDLADVTTNGLTTAFSTDVATASITITGRNDAPTYQKGEDIELSEDAAAQVFASWATVISPGPADEVAQGQVVHFNIVYNTASDLFTAGGQPSLAPDGTLTFTPAPNAYGVATVIFDLQDDGGTLFSGSDTSDLNFFTITLLNVNDMPSFTAGSNQTAAEDSGPQSVASWATAISAGPENESWQDLTFVFSENTNPSLFSSAPAISADGTLTYTPAANAYGSATLTFHLHDGGGTLFGGTADSASVSFLITISPVNDPPVNTGLPAVSGLAYVDETLSTTTGAWNDLIDETPGSLPAGAFTYAYQWQRADDDLGTNLADISGANSAAYTALFADNGKYLRVKVTATDSAHGLPAHQSTAAFSTFTRVEIVNLDASVSAFSRSTPEDVLLRFSAADFSANFTHSASLPIAWVRITRLPETGVLFLDSNSSGAVDSGEALTPGQEIAAADLNALAFLTPANWHGSDSFAWNATADLTAGYPLPGPGAAVTITVSAVNDAPALTEPSLLHVSEGTPSLPISVSLSDVDDDLQSPVSNAYTLSLACDFGSLQLASSTGLIIDSGAEGTSSISLRGALANLQAAVDGVVYTPQAGYTGQDEIRLSFADDGSSGSGGALSDTGKVILLVSDVNAAPTNILPDSFNLLLNTSSLLDFEFMDDSSYLMQVTFSAQHGSITLASTTYLTLVSGANASHDLTYRGPVLKMVKALLGVRYAADADYVGPDSITFTTNDLGGTGAGGPLSASSSVALTVKSASVTLTIPNPPTGTFVVGQLMPVTVHVAAETPVPTLPVGEKLTITNASGDTCQATLLASGDATCSMLLSDIGAHAISVSYSGTSLYNSQSLSAVLGPTTAAANLKITIPNPPTGPFKVGEPFTVTALVAPAAPSTTIPVGSQITLSYGTETCQATILADGTAACDLLPRSTTSPDLSVSIPASRLYNAGSSDPVSGPEIRKGTLEVSIPNPPAGPFEVGHPISITALVTPLAPTTIIPAGETVEIGSGAVHCHAVIQANGSAACTVTPTATGQPDLTSLYPGSANFAAAGPSTTAGPAVTAAHLTLSIPTPPTTPVVTGQPYSVTALVAPGSGGSLIPVGETVTISAGVDQCTATILANGTATCDITPTSAGSSTTLVVAYATTTQFLSGASQPVDAPAASKALTSLAFDLTNSSANPANPGETLHFHAAVSVTAPGSGTPGGKVTFSIDGAPFGSPVDLVNGLAVSPDTAALTPGDHLISVSYAGDLNYAAAVDASFHQLILTSGTSALVTPETGAVLLFTGYQHGLPVTTTIVIPPDAVPAGVTVVFSRLDSTDLPNPAGLNIAASFTIQVFSAGVLQPGYTFLLPIDVSLGFDPANFDLNYLTVLGWDGKTNTWSSSGITVSGIDPKEHTAAFSIAGSIPVEFALAGQTEFFTFLPLLTTPIPAYSLQWSIGLGFEDLPLVGLVKNDFDFNDFTLQIDGTSYYAVGGGALLEGLTLDFLPNARGSSFHHSFKFGIPAGRFSSSGTVTLQIFDANHVLLRSTTSAFTPGTDNVYEIFADTADAFPLGKTPGGVVNSRETDLCIDGQRSARLSFTFDTPFSFNSLNQVDLQRSSAPALFFNPILDVLDTGERIQSSDNRILVIPDSGWKHPEEGIRIDKAYPLVSFTDGFIPNISFPADWWLTFNHCVFDGVACTLPAK